MFLEGIADLFTGNCISVSIGHRDDPFGDPVYLLAKVIVCVKVFYEILCVFWR